MHDLPIVPLLLGIVIGALVSLIHGRFRTNSLLSAAHVQARNALDIATTKFTAQLENSCQIQAKLLASLATAEETIRHGTLEVQSLKIESALHAEKASQIPQLELRTEAANAKLQASEIVVAAQHERLIQIPELHNKISLLETKVTEANIQMSTLQIASECEIARLKALLGNEREALSETRRKSENQAKLLLETTVELGTLKSEIQLLRGKAKEAPSAIVLGMDQNRPAIRIEPLTESEKFGKRKTAPISATLKGRATAALQAVPSLLIAEGHRGRTLMEVVISGDLVRASTGEGFRAWAVGATGKINEQATLLDINNLNNIVNGAAIWQIASVIVAQKHLADISQKLADINKGVERIGQFLDSERRSKIVGTYNYLQQAAGSIEGGELPNSIRNQLEACERDLMAIQCHLTDEYRSGASEQIIHSDTFGTKVFTDNFITRFSALEKIAMDLRTCLKTRVLAWYVLCLFPGDASLKAARRDSIMQSISDIASLRQAIDARLAIDMPRFNSVWNSNETIESRKQKILDAARNASDNILSFSRVCQEEALNMDRLLTQRDRPMHLLVEANDREILDVAILR